MVWRGRVMDAGEFFAVGWPELVPRLRAMLARAGAPVVEREDLVQETALRLFGMWDSVDPGRPIEPLARRIAMNAWRDQWRRRGEREVVGLVPELAAAADTERSALARVEVTEVARALSTLPVRTATVLRVAAGEAESDEPGVPTSGSLRMARTRARRALVSCLKVASAVVVATVAGIRSLSKPATAATAVGALAAFACVLALTVPGPRTLPELARADQPVTSQPSGPAAGTGNVTRSSGASPATRRVTPQVHHRRAATEPPYYVIDPGPASVGVFLDVNIAGSGVQVGKPGPGQAQPVCGYGDTPTTVLTPRCSQP